MRDKKFTLVSSLTTFIGMAVIICFGLLVLQLSTLTVFVVSTLWISVMGILKGYGAKELEGFFVEGIKSAAPIIAILMSVGILIGTWISSGTIPSIIYYGMDIIKPNLFFVVAFLVSSLSSVFVGSSYSCIATMGVAFMGIGYGLNLNPGAVAGAAVAGAVFGDKMSPFSDTTNLAPALSGTDLFSHIRSMLYTTGPAFIISLVLYFILGMKAAPKGTIDLTMVHQISDAMQNTFYITPLLLILPIITIILAVKKVPPVTAIVISSLIALIAGLILQRDHIPAANLIISMADGYTGESGIEQVDKLLNRGGVTGMMGTVATTTFALCMGEMLQRLGVLHSIMSAMSKVVNSVRKMVVATLFSSLLTNMITGSQYMALVLPGQMFKDMYREKGVQPYVLSRTLEDGGTIFTFMVPWAAGAVYASGVLDIPATSYIPWCFFALLSPTISLIYGIFDIFLFRIKDKGAD